MPQAAPKMGENSVGAALCGRPGRGACSGHTIPPTQGGHIGPPLQAPPYFQNRGAQTALSNGPSLSSPVRSWGRPGEEGQRTGDAQADEVELFERIDRRPERVEIELQPLTAGDLLQRARAGPQDVDISAFGVELEDLQAA